jgi:hypothetical protein
MLEGLIDETGRNFQWENLAEGIFSLPLDLLYPLFKPREVYCDVSVTELVTDIRQVILKRRYSYFASTDDMEDILDGNSHHLLLHNAAPLWCSSEEELLIDVDGTTVGGRIDFIDSNNCLWDWKRTSINSIQYLAHGDCLSKTKPEHYWQVQVYSYLLALNGKPVDGAYIRYSARDWRVSENNTREKLIDRYINGDTYQSGKRRGEPIEEPPPYPRKLIRKVPLLPLVKIEEYVRNKCAEYSKYIKYSAENEGFLPVCNTWKDDNRCKRYCPVAANCSYGKKFKGGE